MIVSKVLGKNSETCEASERLFQLLMFSGTPSKIISSKVLACLSNSVKETSDSETIVPVESKIDG